MKRILYFAIACFALCSCTRDLAEVVQTKDIVFDFSVAGFSGDPDTRAIKHAWENGDVINIWFERDEGKHSFWEPDLVLTFNGDSWTSGTLREGCTISSSGKFCAMYESKNLLSSWYGSTKGLTVVSNDRSYKMSNGKVTAKIDGWEFLTSVQIVVTGLDPEEASQYYAYSSFLGGLIDVVFDGTKILQTYYNRYSTPAGFPNEDGVVFYFWKFHIVEGQQPYIRITDNLDQDHYYYLDSPLPESGTGFSAYKIPASKFVDEYGHVLGTSRTVNTIDEPLPDVACLVGIGENLSENAVVEENVDWIYPVGIVDGKLYLEISDNYCPERTATVNVKAGGKTTSYVVTQKESEFRKSLIKFYNAFGGPQWIYSEYWCSDIPFNEWYGVSGRKGRYSISLMYDKHSGEIPDMFDEFADYLVGFCLSEDGDLADDGKLDNVKGTLPPSFAKCTKLESLCLYHTTLSSIPDFFYNMPDLKCVRIEDSPLMSCPLPESLGNKDGMTMLYLMNCGLTGSIPQSWYKNLDVAMLSGNKLSGAYPECGSAEKNMMYIYNFLQSSDYCLDANEREFKAYWPEPGAYDAITGEVIPFWDIVHNNKYTVVFHWATWCGFTQVLLPKLKAYYDKYKKDGLAIIAYSTDSSDYNERIEYIHDNELEDWHHIFMDKNEEFWMNSGALYHTRYTPSATVVDENGNVVFASIDNISDPIRGRFYGSAFDSLIPFLENLFGPASGTEEYESKDYSHDGEVMTLQTATVGTGTNVVFMGDGFDDRTMESGGKYEEIMTKAMEEFFAIEPYKSLRDRFNVYAVKAVSKYGKVMSGKETAFSCYHGEGSFIGGDNDKVMTYAQKVPGITSNADLLAVVMVNSSESGGTAHMVTGLNSSVTYVPLVGSYGDVLRHEAGGHGYAFLADEYDGNGAIDQATVAEVKELQAEFGWYANVDFTSDPTNILWAWCLSDPDYSKTVGIYEGGYTYNSGVWRPTLNSCMRYNDPYFNAPSREAIYKRVMLRTGGDASHEAFLAFDRKNLEADLKAKQSSSSRRDAKRTSESSHHTHSPVVYLNGFDNPPMK